MTHLERWTVQNKMKLNAKKTKDMWITFNKSCPVPPPICIGPAELERVTVFKLLGVYVQNDLKWNTCLKYCQQNRCKQIHYLRAYRKSHLSRDVGLTAYITKMRPVLEYALPVWGGLPIYIDEDLHGVQNSNRCHRTLHGYC